MTKIRILLIIFLFSIIVFQPFICDALTPDNQYHHYEDLVSDLMALEKTYLDIAKVFDLGDSWEKENNIQNPDGTPINRDIFAIRISSNPTVVDPNKPDILIIGSQHANEWIGVEVSRFIAKELVTKYATDPYVRHLVDSVETWIIPMVNPDGHQYCAESSYWRKKWRKNRHDNNNDGVFDPDDDGVDLNRNWGYKHGLEVDPWPDWVLWNNDTSHTPGNILYCGETAFSEPEIRSIRDLVISPLHQFKAHIDFHSGTEFVLWPPSYRKNPTQDQPLFEMLGKMMGARMGYEAKQASDLYLASGVSIDWVYFSRGIPGFCIELSKKFIPEVADIIPICQKARDAIFDLMFAIAQPNPVEEEEVSTPGHDNPDDYVGIISEEQAQALSQIMSPKIAVMGNGFWYSFVCLADHVGKTCHYEGIDFSPGILEEYPVLVIPSGGLYGLDNSEAFKRSLEEYIQNGGTVIVFSQQHGYEYNALPGNISAYGWTEDQSCQWRSSYIDTYHQILSGQDSATCDIVVDGYFGNWPENSTILLRRSRNGMPCMLMYEYGNGRVIATSIFEDWGYTHGQKTQDGIRLVRDLLAWAEDPKLLPECSPGDDIDLSINIVNDFETDAEQVKITIRNPDQQIIEEKILSQAVGDGQTVTINHLLSSVGNHLGIWYVNYTLLDAAGDIVLPERPGERFVVSDPQEVSVNKGITFAVTSPSDSVAFGSDIPFTIHIWNHTDEQREISFKTHYEDWGLRMVLQGKEIEGTLTIPPQDEATFPHTLQVSDVPLSHNQLIYYAYFYDEDDKSLGSALKLTWMFTPSVDINVETDRDLCCRGEDVLISLSLQNRKSVSCNVNLTVKVLDQENSKLFEENREVYLGGSASVIESTSFVLPNEAVSGMYRVYVEVYDAFDGKIGSDSTYFQVPEAIILIDPIVPGIIVAGTNTFTLNLENLGIEYIAGAPLELKLINPNGDEVWEDTRNIDLASNEPATFDFKIPFSDIPIFGDYLWTYFIDLGTKTVSGSKVISCSADMELSFDRSSYRMHEDVGMDLRVTNTGSFRVDPSVTLSCPDMPYDYTSDISLSPGQSWLIHLSAVIAEATLGGKQDVNVTLGLEGGSTLSKVFSFFIEPAQLKLTLHESAYAAGQTVSGYVENIGGIDSPFDYHLTLQDIHCIICFDTNGSLPPIEVSGIAPINFELADYLGSGKYLLKAVFTDSEGRAKVERKLISVAGLEPVLDITTDKPEYAGHEDIEAIFAVTDLQAPLIDARLDLSVFKNTGPRWGQYTNTNNISAIAVDEDAIWFAMDFAGVSRYDKVSNTWRTYTTADGLGYYRVWGAAIDKDYVWFATYGGGVSRYDKSSGTWKTYNFMEKGYLYNYVQTIGAYGDDVWAGTSLGAVRYDRSSDTWQTYSSSIIPKACRRVSSIAVDEKAVWFSASLSSCGVRRYDKVYETWQQIYATADGLASNYIGSIAIDEDSVWFGTNGSGVSCYDEFSGTWRTYTTADGLASNYIGGIAIDEDAVWVGTYEGMSRYDKLLGTWQTYTTADGLASNFVGVIASDEGSLWFGTLGGLTQFVKKEKPLLETAIAVNLMGDGTITEQIAGLDEPGKFYIQGSLISNLGQTLATDRTSFYVNDSPVILTFSTDKAAYRPGEPIVLNGLVTNRGTEDAADLNLLLMQDLAQFYTETFSLSAGQSHPFTTTISGAAKSFTLEASIGGLRIYDYVIVENPEVEVTVDAPDVVGRDPFTMNLIFENTGHFDATVQFELDGDLNTISFKPGETKVIEIETSITQDTTLEIILTGDVTGRVEHEISLGEKISLLLPDEAFYPEGRVNIPYTLSNTGTIDSEFDLMFTLNGQSLTKRLFVPAGQTLSDSLVYDLEAGIYTLTYSAFFGNGSIDFRVARINQVETDVNIFPIVNGSLPMSVMVTNVGSNVFTGQLRISSDFYTSTTDLSLNVGQSLKDHEWIEVSESSADYYEQANNDYLGPFDLPFTVTLEGMDYDSFEMSSNGSIELIPVGSSGHGIDGYGYKSDLIEDDDYSDATLIMASYDDLYSRWYGYYGYQVFKSGDIDAGGAVVDRDCIVFCWNTPTHDDYSPDYMNKFEVVLYPDGTIMWNFDSMNFDDYGYDMYSGIYVGSTGLDLEAGRAIDTQSSYSLSPGGTQIFRYGFMYINLDGAEPGIYDLDVDTLHNGYVISHTREQFEVLGASFELSSIPVDPVYTPGQEATMAFKVKNIGMVEGEAEIRLTVLDLLDETRFLWIAPEMEEEIDFIFMIPDDLPEKGHKAIIELNAEMTEISFLVSGIKIDVSASLDKVLYSVGDTATLTLDITNESDLYPEMHARASSNSYEDIQGFTLVDHQTVALSLPVDESTPDKISYGIYLASGRAVYLSSVYIHLVQYAITLYPDRGIYQAGDTVKVSVETAESGGLWVSAPGYEETMTISGSTHFEFTLPEEMVSGRYGINYRFGDHAGVCHFDVEGYSAKVLEVLLDKAVYEPVDTMDISFNIEVNQDIPGILKGWIYSPDGVYTELFEISREFFEGENRLDVHEGLIVPLYGIHRVVYALYDASSLLCLVTGAEAFDVKEAAITQILTDKATYGEAESVTATVKTFASVQYSGAIDLLLNGSTIATQAVTLLGEEEFGFDLVSLPSGHYTLIARLHADEVISEKQVTFNVVDMAPPENPTGLSIVLEGWTVILDWNANSEGDLAGYNIYRNGIKLNAVATRAMTYRDEAITAGIAYRYYITAVDTTGNESEPSDELSITLDNMPPVITISPSTDITAGIPITITYSVVDNLDPTPTITASYPSPTTLDLDGMYTLTVEAEDDSGNRASRWITITLIGLPTPFERLTGTITAAEDPIFLGLEEAFLYAVTNDCRRDISDLIVRVLIVDPSTGETKDTLEAIITVPMESTTQGNLNLSTIDLMPQVYSTILEVALADKPEPRVLDTSTFEVLPSLEVTKMIPDSTNLLVWINDGCHTYCGYPYYTDNKDSKKCPKGGDRGIDCFGDQDDGEAGIECRGKKCSKPECVWHEGLWKECIRVDLLERSLNEAGTSYLTVYERSDFEREMRNPFFTDILILGDRKPLGHDISAELIEKVYSGTGLISSLWIEHKTKDSIFGVRLKGKVGSKCLVIQTVESPISSEDAFDAKGSANKIEAMDGTTIAGWIETENCGINNAWRNKKTSRCYADREYPAIVLNEYGIGKTIYLAFDLGLTLNDDNYDQLAELMKSAITYVHRTADTSAFYPYQLVPVELELKSPGGSLDVRITETFPSELNIYDTGAQEWIGDSPWIINTYIEPDETTAVLYYALTPDMSGIYSMDTEVGFIVDNTYTFFQNLSNEIVVDMDTTFLIGDIIAELDALSVSKKDRSKVKTVIRLLEKVQERAISSERDVSKNIHDVLRAIDSLLLIKNIDTKDIRLMLDVLLRVEEGMYYYFVPLG